MLGGGPLSDANCEYAIELGVSSAGSERGLVVGRRAAPTATTLATLLAAGATCGSAGVATPTALLAAALRSTLATLLATTRRPLAASVAASRPRVIGLTAPTAAALSATGTLRAVHLGGGAAQRRADLVDVELEDRALLALFGFVGTALEPALHDDAGAAREGLGNVLRSVAPDRAADEQRFAVLPLVALPVERAGSARLP